MCFFALKGGNTAYTNSDNRMLSQDLAAQLEGQQSDMNEEYMAMVLALDMMLDPEGGNPAEEE